MPEIEGDQLQKWQFPFGPLWTPELASEASILHFQAEGDWLVGTRISPPPQRRPVEEIELERRLYLRLSDAAELCQDGQVRLRPDWREQAVQFSNLYAPPVGRESVDASRAPIQVFADEALLMTWALRVKDCLLDVKQYKRPRPAVMAAIQINALKSRTPADSPDRERERQRGAALATEPASLPIEITEQLAHELFWLWKGDGVDEVYAGWQYAATALSDVTFNRAQGATPFCAATQLKRGAIRFNSGFLFTSPLSRVWFGFWEELGGVRHRCCPKCGGWFTTRRITKRYCSLKCQNAAKVARCRKTTTGRKTRGRRA